MLSTILTLAAALATADAYTVTEWEWIAVATIDGKPTIVAGAPLVPGTCYGHCYIRAISNGAGEIVEWSCPGTLACKPGCEEQTRPYPDYTLIWCDCTGSGGAK